MIFYYVDQFKYTEPVKSHYDTNVCHSRESGNPLIKILTSSWIPAFAGMTTIYGASICKSWLINNYLLNK